MAVLNIPNIILKVQEHYSRYSFLTALSLLSKKDQYRLWILTMAQILSGLLDLCGVILIGTLGALSIQGIESHGPGNQVSRVLQFLKIQNYTFQSQVLILTLIAVLFFVAKTFISILFTKKTIKFLSRKGADLSGELISKILSKDLTFIQERSTQEILFNVFEGVKNLTSGVLSTSSLMIADMFTLLILSVGLLIMDPVLAVSTFSLFIFAALVLHGLLNRRAGQMGEEFEQLTVKSNQKLSEVLHAYREISVHNRREYYAANITSLRLAFAEVGSEFAFQPYIGKYVMESLVIMGTFAVAGFEFATKSAVHAASTMAVFVAASTRIAPAILRIQQNALVIRNSAGSTKSTLALFVELKDAKVETQFQDNMSFDHEGFVGSVELKGVNFGYPTDNNFSLRDINFRIDPGTSVAIVGPSGAGKTTLVDLILGLLVPQSGKVEISGKPPSETIAKWPGSISYVPQSVVAASGSFRENVSLGYPIEVASDGLVWNVLKMAQLKDTVELLPNKLDEEVGENASRISGGQLQRLGIARALFTNPKLLVLDEATSALDGQTEADISSAIAALAGKTTTIIVAHRLSTVRATDLVLYIDNGSILAMDKFETVRTLIPNFDKQAKLMGL